MDNNQKVVPGLVHNATGFNDAQKKDKRNRIQFRFWLDANKDDQAEWGRALDEMRTNPRMNFAKFMRDAIRLLLSLRRGDTSVLLELFPAIAIRQSEPSPASVDFEAMMRELSSLKELVQAPHIAPNSSVSSNGGIQGIAGANKPLAAPTFDDEDDEPLLAVQKDEDAGRRANENFLKSMMALQNS